MFVLYNPKKNHSTFSLPGLARRIISFFNRVEACLTRNEQRAAQDDEVHPYALLSLCRISIKVSKMIFCSEVSGSYNVHQKVAFPY